MPKKKPELDLLSAVKAVSESAGEPVSGNGTQASPAPTYRPTGSPAHDPVPPILEYRTITGERWRVEKFEDLVAEFALIPDPRPQTPDPWRLAMFHEAALGYSRGWLIVRRLFGIAPLIPSPDADLEDLRPWSRPELAAALGLDGKQLQAEIDAVRVLCRKAEGQRLNAEVKEMPKVNPTSAFSLQPLAFAEDILHEFGFTDKMFVVKWWDEVKKEHVLRDAESNRIERDWFAKRVTEWAKFLREPMSALEARQALLNEIYLRRIEGDMTMMQPGTPEFRKISKDKDELEAKYAQQRKALDEMFPGQTTAGRMQSRDTLDAAIAAYWEYKANGDNRFINAWMTAAEMEVDLRQSVQAPEPAHRFGLTVAIMEARHGLYDPNFKPALRHEDLKRLDAGCKAGIELARQATNQPLIDLEKDEEYPELQEVVNSQSSVVSSNGSP